jgi:hypothetical protein
MLSRHPTQEKDMAEKAAPKKEEHDAWHWLSEAERAGWQDPGQTEPLEDTVRRAKEYLAAQGKSE